MYKILKSATLRQSTVTIGGTLINGALGALFYVYLARFLGPADFGLLYIAISVLTLVSDITDLGVGTGLVKFIPSLIKNDPKKAYSYLKLGLEIKLITSLVILVLGYFIAPLVAVAIFSRSELIIPLQVAFLGVGTALLFNYAVVTLQAFERFVGWSLINIFSNSFRLIILVVLIYLGSLNLLNGLWLYVLVPLFGFFVTMLFLPTSEILASKGELKLINSFFGYNKWVAIFILIAAISSRLDTFLSAKLLTNQEVGLYSAANQLSSYIPQLVGSLGVVVAPKFSSFTGDKQMFDYFKKLQFLTLGISVALIALLPLAGWLVSIFYGLSYQSMLPAFFVLVLAMIIFLISVPVHNSILYYYGKPEIFTWIAIGHLLVVGILGYILINRFGMMGAAISVLAGNLFNFITPLVWLIRKIK